MVSAIGVVAFVYPFFQAGGDGTAAYSATSHTQDAPLLFAVLIVLCLGAVLGNMLGSGLNAKMVAALGVLTATNAVLRAVPGPMGFSAMQALPILADPRLLRLQPYGRIFWGYPPPSVAKPIGEVVETTHHRFQVIHTPGHSPDHICLYGREKGWLFTGDAYIGGRDRALRADYDIYAIIDSLKKLAELETSRLFPGSGTVRDNPRQDLVRKIEYLEETGSRVRELHQKGLSLSQIRKEVFGGEMPIAYITLGHFSARNLARSYLESSSSAAPFS